ncbi:homocysteine S-methyltransferase family protein [bacterium]|nr:homocysteine S-methyltransferase family protein [bacterium]
MKSLTEALKEKHVLLSDGAWGTYLQAMGLDTGECPEYWNILHPDEVRSIAQSYIDAGSDMVLTNSFGGSPFKLKYYGLSGKTSELNEAAARLSREAAGDRFVLGSMGPSGKMLLMGDITVEEWVHGFGEQAEALARGGADAICIETMSALDEALCAIEAARERTSCEIICTFTFGKTAQGDYRSMMGVSPVNMAEAVLKAGAHIIGANCGNGMEQMVDIVREFREVTPDVPILVHANAGLPRQQDGQTVFPETPEQTARWIPAIVEAGASIVGGCCGTTPDHIRAMAAAIRALGLQAVRNRPSERDTENR